MAENQSGGDNSGGYTPSPVQRTRSITGLHTAVNEDTLNQVSEQVKQSRRSVDPSSSIQINLTTIDKTTQHVIEEEQRVQEKFAQFDPLSATPVMAQPSPSQDVIREDWASTPIPDALTPSSYDAPRAPMPNLYKGRRRFTYVMMMISAIALWFIIMALQVGVERLLNDPIGETKQAMGYQNTQSVKRQSSKVIPTTQVVVERGQPEVSITAIEPFAPRVFVVRGVLANRSNKTVEAARIKVTLASPEGSRSLWARSKEFNCCTQVQAEGFDKKQRKTKAKQLLSDPDSMHAEEVQLNIDVNQRVTFSVFATLKASDKLKRGELPLVSAQLLYFE